MKATLDFELKTISLDTPISLKEIKKLSKCLVDYEEWAIIAPVMTVSVPTIWVNEPMPTAQGTWVDTNKAGVTLT